MARIVYDGRLAGSFYGFNRDMLFELPNGTYLIQAKYKYWYRYRYRPYVIISQEGNRLFLTVENHTVEVRPVSVIKSRIDGDFEGWQGESTYRLFNGQVWQQAVYKYTYKYAYNPEVLIYNSGGHYVMRVAGTDAVVRRIE